VYVGGSRQGRSISRYSSALTFSMPKNGAAGAVSYSVNAVSRRPASRTAETISPRPWFHS
jgi:hypothetical protein